MVYSSAYFDSSHSVCGHDRGSCWLGLGIADIFNLPTCSWLAGYILCVRLSRASLYLHAHIVWAAPAENAIEYQVQVFDGRMYAPNKYKDKPSPEVDQAWTDLYDGDAVFP